MFLLTFFGIMFLCIFVAIAMYLSRGTYEATTDGFSQAGVSVSNTSKTINISGYSYSVDAVTRITYESGFGPHGNISYAKVMVRDLQKPVHQIKFITANGAQTFANRLSVALEQAGGPRLD